MTNGKEHPCLKRLDANCFREHPAWAKQALAYRLLHCLAPEQITRRLPKGLRLALLTPDIPMPPGIDIPPIIDTPPVLPPETPGPGPAPPLYIEPWSPGPVIQPGKWAPTGQVYTAYSTTQDGQILYSHANWDTCRTALTGLNFWTTYTASVRAMRAQHTGAVYSIRRSFLMMDLTAITPGKTVKTAVLEITAYLTWDSAVSVQQGTQDTILTTHDYDAFTGSAFAFGVWQTGVNQLIFNAAGRAYVQACLGDYCYLALREYTHDYSNIPPETSTLYDNGMHYQEWATQADRPHLLIEV